MDKDPVQQGTNAELEAGSKRRKVRKGTRSCWDCKKRKMKCLFESSPASTEAEICIGCKKRGSKCVSQTFDIPDEIATPKRLKRRGRMNGDGDHERVLRLKALVEQLTEKVGSDGSAAAGKSPPIREHGWEIMPTPVSIDSGSSSCEKTFSDEHHGHDTTEIESKCERLARDLYDALPSREDIGILCKAGSPGSIRMRQKLTTPYTILNKNGFTPPETLLDIPGRNTHPVLMARYMLHLASFLQLSQPSSEKETEQLSEPAQVMMKRLAETAVSLVTTRSELLGSLEGLECVMIESLYEHNLGNLRRSWIAMRRAMVIAQLMGLHRARNRAQYKVLDPTTTSDPQFMWFRIVFFDRHFCLMLGLPQGSLDRSMASDQMLGNDTPMGRLERMHCDLASQILELNESEPGTHYFALTQQLEEGLRRAARNLPSKWWLPDSTLLFEASGRLFCQLFHYNLLNQLHLPFMLRSSAERKYDYSKITCVNASRDVLQRFLLFRTFDEGKVACRPLDFFALMASMTLLLAHLDSHRYPQNENILAHQYLSDRAMVEQTQENMERLSHRDEDSLTTKSAALLRRLLAILGEAADGNTHGVERVSVSVKAPETEMERPDEDSSSALRFFVPYCGIIKIAREGVISKEIPKAQYSVAGNVQNELASLSQFPHAEVSASIETGQYGVKGVPSMLPPQSAAGAPTQIQRGNSSNPPIDSRMATGQVAAQSPSVFSDPFLQQDEPPLLTAGMDDWAFQGVDTAFFNSLMRGVEEDGNNSAAWGEWHDAS